MGHGLVVYGMAKFQALKLTFQRSEIKPLVLLVGSRIPLKFQVLNFQISGAEIWPLHTPPIHTSPFACLSFVFFYLFFAFLSFYRSPRTWADNCNLLETWGVSFRLRLRPPRSKLSDF